MCPFMGIVFNKFTLIFLSYVLNVLQISVEPSYRFTFRNEAIKTKYVGMCTWVLVEHSSEEVVLMLQNSYLPEC